MKITTFLQILDNILLDKYFLYEDKVFNEETGKQPANG